MTATRQGLICDQNTITPFANLTFLINGGQQSCSSEGGMLPCTRAACLLCPAASVPLNLALPPTSA